jgi:hypothetical protein
MRVTGVTEGETQTLATGTDATEPVPAADG